LPSRTGSSDCSSAATRSQAAPEAPRGATVYPRELLQRALRASNGFRFAGAYSLGEAFGSRLARVSGSHHVDVHPAIREPISLKDVHGQAKACQTNPLLQLVERHNLETR
jgi:hypothetical protein